MTYIVPYQWNWKEWFPATEYHTNSTSTLGSFKSAWGYGTTRRMHKTDEAVYIDAEMPGFAPEDIDVLLEDGAVRVKARRKLRGGGEDTVEFQQELPRDADLAAARSTYKNGILTITLPFSSDRRKKLVVSTE